MSVILEFTVEDDQFTLGSVLSGPPSMRIELERIVPTGDAVMPFLWVAGDDFEAFEAKVRGSADVADLAAIDRIEDETLYRITWKGTRYDIVRGISEAEGTLLEGYNRDGWEFHVRFNDHNRVSQFYNYCNDKDIDIHVVRMFTFTHRSDSVHQFGLTNEQREALLLGLRTGYFDTPSKVTLEELATRLGISQQAMSNRIRRGTKQVLDETLRAAATEVE